MKITRHKKILYPWKELKIIKIKLRIKGNKENKCTRLENKNYEEIRSGIKSLQEEKIQSFPWP